MIQARRILVLVIPMLILACRSTVLPADEIPSDFVFGYEFTRLTDAPPSNEVGPSAESDTGSPAEEGMEMPADEGMEMPADEGMEMPADEGGEMPADEGEEMPADEGMEAPADEGAEPQAPERLPVEMPTPVESAPTVAPALRIGALRHLKFEVRGTGVVEYLVEYQGPDATKRTGRAELDEQTLRRIYDRVRAADLPGRKSRNIGEDPTLGRETYHLIGAELREFWVDVEGMRVDPLTELWNDVFRMLPDQDILEPPPPETKAFLLDRTTGKIHRVNCPQAADVVDAARIPLPNPEAGLNLGGYPCEECRPLGK